MLSRRTALVILALFLTTGACLAQMPSLEGRWTLTGSHLAEPAALDLTARGNGWITDDNDAPAQLKLNPSGLKDQWMGVLQLGTRTYQVDAKLTRPGEVQLKLPEGDERWHLKAER